MRRDKRPLSRRDPSRRQVLTAAVAAIGLPAIGHAREAPLPLEIYGRLPAISRVAISPDGRRVALIRHKAGVMTLEDRDLVTGESVSSEVGGDLVPVLFWASNERIFLVISESSQAIGTRYEAWIGVIADVREHRHYQLFSEMQEYVPNLNGDFHRVKMRRGYCVTASNSHPTSNNYPVNYATALYAFSADHFRPDRLDEDARRILNWAVRGDGSLAARAEYDEDTRLWQLRFHGSFGWRVVYKIIADLDLPLLKGMGLTRDKVLIYFNTGERTDAYVEVGEDGVFGETLATNRAKSTPLFDPLSGLLIGFSNSDGLDQSLWLDKDHADLAQALEHLAPQPVAEQVDLAEDPHRSLVYAEGPASAGTYYVADLAAGVMTSLGETYPDLQPGWLLPKQAITYTAGDGLVLDGYLTRPRPEWGPRPALIVLPHGGPESFDDNRFDYTAQALASRGYQVLQPNFRGSSHRGRDFVARGYGELGRRMQSDLSDGVQYLISQGMADPGRVAIAGASYGGYAALAGVSLQDGIYNCAVSIAGFTDIGRYMDTLYRDARSNTHARTLIYWRRFFGDQDRWDAVSPLSHAAQIKVPVLLIHGRVDEVVDVEQSQAMQKALAALGKPVELVLMDDEDHYLSRESTRIQALQAMMDFLVKYNPPG